MTTLLIADHNGAGDGIVVVQQTVTLTAGTLIGVDAAYRPLMTPTMAFWV